MQLSKLGQKFYPINWCSPYFRIKINKRPVIGIWKRSYPSYRINTRYSKNFKCLPHDTRILICQILSLFRICIKLFSFKDFKPIRFKSSLGNWMYSTLIKAHMLILQLRCCFSQVKYVTYNFDLLDIYWFEVDISQQRRWIF